MPIGGCANGSQTFSFAWINHPCGNYVPSSFIHHTFSLSIIQTLVLTRFTEECKSTLYSPSFYLLLNRGKILKSLPQRGE